MTFERSGVSLGLRILRVSGHVHARIALRCRSEAF